MPIQAEQQEIRHEDTFPLRIMNGRRLCCPHELFPNDRAVITYETDDNLVARVHLSSIEPRPLERDIFYSRTDSKHILTMGGYTFDGPVTVTHWKEHPTNPEEQKSFPALEAIELIHSPSLPQAFEDHVQRIGAVRVLPFSLRDADELYRAMVYHVPRY